MPASLTTEQEKQAQSNVVPNIPLNEELIIRNTFVNAQLVSTEESVQQQEVVSKADLLAALKSDKRKKSVQWRDG
jgi:hypothetical protein